MGTDKHLIRKRFEASFSRYHRLALVQRDICAELGKIAAGLCVRGNVSRAMEIGVGTGFLTSHLVRLFPDAEWYLNDISSLSLDFLRDNMPSHSTFLCGDAENMEFPRHLDLIASASTVQWFYDMPGFALKAAGATNRGGWLVMSTFGTDNFREIRETTGEGLHYHSFSELCGIFKTAGYEIVSGVEYTRTLRFDTPVDVLRHIKATGVNSLVRTHWGPRQLAAFDDKYRKTHSVEGGVTLTYNPILIAARKR